MSNLVPGTPYTPTPTIPVERVPTLGRTGTWTRDTNSKLRFDFGHLNFNLSLGRESTLDEEEEFQE